MCLRSTITCQQLMHAFFPRLFPLLKVQTSKQHPRFLI
uniref:Uncharacterized protein n=2 Tax=Arundo donax TaxID=35708 RepID=A0A0A9EKH7_ARUDO